ncbi:phosphoribosylglycinamide formyltransferase [Bacillus sp. FJAT-45037]|uniref:phosphoribosylglycinamide formyltransferase n=1 Tax=Bacillus sp. FJAT-45037 TaxID=2011007 RepID=UPI000C24BEAE|nr:phosphoribosylglycinamide formyltransferase [Bacillus sp. FJAT-45037]
MKIAVFASGTGTNAEVLMNAAKVGRLRAEIVLVVSDKPTAKVLDRAKLAGVETFAFQPSNYENKKAFEKEIVQELRSRNVDAVVLAGYMRLVGPTLLSSYEERMVNIHPSLLPKFPGLDAIGQAYRAGVKETGVTIHLVDAGMDTGPIMAQQKIEIASDDTIETLTKKIQAVEHQLYPETIHSWIESMELEGVKKK